MPVFYSGDPLLDAHRYDAWQIAQIRRRPKCCECGEHIQDEFAYRICEKWYCEGCLNENYRKAVDDYIE